MSECRPDSDGDSAAAEPSVEAAVERIRDRGRAVRAEQVQRALSELDGELSDHERAVIESLGERLVERLLAIPEERLRTVAREGDGEAIERALDLFG